jgi:hypothetical protein
LQRVRGRPGRFDAQRTVDDIQRAVDDTQWDQDVAEPEMPVCDRCAAGGFGVGLTGLHGEEARLEDQVVNIPQDWLQGEHAA